MLSSPYRHYDWVIDSVLCFCRSFVRTLSVSKKKTVLEFLSSLFWIPPRSKSANNCKISIPLRSPLRRSLMPAKVCVRSPNSRWRSLKVTLNSTATRNTAGWRRSSQNKRTRRRPKNKRRWTLLLNQPHQLQKETPKVLQIQCILAKLTCRILCFSLVHYWFFIPPWVTFKLQRFDQQF